MTRSNVARRQGDDFQARLFWLKASCLLDPGSPILSVSYETGPKSFDDIMIEYDPKRPARDHRGKPVFTEHIQCKWHTTGGTFGYRDLVDPAFINASTNSLLQRVQQAQRQHAPDGFGCRFKFVTNWFVNPDDALTGLIRKESGALDLDKLFDGTTDASRTGNIRKLWREHLELDHGDLELVARILAVGHIPQSLEELRERLDERFAYVGMKRVPLRESGFFYDDVIAKLHAQGRVRFDRETFREMCRQEGLLQGTDQTPHLLTVGIRSFMHAFDNLEDRCERVLDLVPYFDGRYIRNDSDWQQRLLPLLRDFLLKAARSTEHLRLVLDAHVSLAVAAGSILNVKAGKHMEIEQRSPSRRVWSMDDEPPTPDWPKLTFDLESLDESQSEVAVTIGLTRHISDDVRAFVLPNLHQVGRIFHCRPEGGPSQRSVRCGRHAWVLAESVVNQLSQIRPGGRRPSRVHLFLSGPNGFAFSLGQHRDALGPVSVYEWDFEGKGSAGYSLGLTLG